MKSENILQADILDIVFENRNKAYGAYELRRHYNRRLVKSIIMAFLLGGGMVSLATLVKEENIMEAFIPEPTIYSIPEVTPEQKKPEVPKMKSAPRPPAHAPKTAQQQFVQNIDITSNPADATKLTNDLDHLAIGDKTIPGLPFQGGTQIDPPPATGGGSAAVAAPKVDKETPMLAPEVMPSYPGGMNALKKFMEKNLKSFDDIENGRVISVKITFVVGFDGKLKGFQVLEDGGEIYNREVIRVLKKMPEWIPGKSQGENVSVYYTIPVKFTAAE